jgi:hypothetical protein
VLLVALLSSWVDAVRAYLGPPYLYVTFHGGSHQGVHGDINSIYKYSRDGYLLGEVLVNNSATEELKSLRGMYIGPQGHLHVLNAIKSDTKVVEFSKCDAQGMRHFLQVDVRHDKKADAALWHPYDIDRRFDEEGSGTVFISSQDTRSVVRYNILKHPWVPAEPSEAIKKKLKHPAPGLFIQHDNKHAAIRGIALGRDPKRWLFVADRHSNLITVYDQNGFKTDDIAVPKPISVVAGDGVVALNATNVMLVGSAETGNDGVYKIDQQTGKVLAKYTSKNLVHPAGMTVYGDELFVCSQSTGAIIVFNFTTTEVIRDILTEMPDSPEHLLLSDC